MGFHTDYWSNEIHLKKYTLRFYVSVAISVIFISCSLTEWAEAHKTTALQLVLWSAVPLVWSGVSLLFSSRLTPDVLQERRVSVK